MTQVRKKVIGGLRNLAHKEPEVMSGKVVAGSYDDGDKTIMVLPTSGSDPVGPVMLNGIGGNGKGLVVVPTDGSDVVIACVDGPGEWVLVRASTIDEMMVTIGSTTFVLKDGEIEMNGGALKGLPILDKVVDNLKKLSDYIKNILEPAVHNGINAVGAGGSANGATGAAAFNTAVTGHTISFEDMENTKIKQG